MARSQGFSLIEIMIAVTVLGVISSIAMTSYFGYLETARTQDLKLVSTNINQSIEQDVALITEGFAPSIVSIDSGQTITAERTCDEFVRSLKKKYNHLRNPFDGSPLITISDAWRDEQKRSKIRITCYKILHGHSSGGSNCPINKAGIRVDTYFVDCGFHCMSSSCNITNKNCQGLSTPLLKDDMEENLLYGTITPKINGLRDFETGAKDCGVINLINITHPKETDY